MSSNCVFELSASPRTSPCSRSRSLSPECRRGLSTHIASHRRVSPFSRKDNHLKTRIGGRREVLGRRKTPMEVDARRRPTFFRGSSILVRVERLLPSSLVRAERLLPSSSPVGPPPSYPLYPSKPSYGRDPSKLDAHRDLGGGSGGGRGRGAGLMRHRRPRGAGARARLQRARIACRPDGTRRGPRDPGRRGRPAKLEAPGGHGLRDTRALRDVRRRARPCPRRAARLRLRGSQGRRRHHDVRHRARPAAEPPIRGDGWSAPGGMRREAPAVFRIASGRPTAMSVVTTRCATLSLPTIRRSAFRPDTSGVYMVTATV
jgi:hypothetical protein